MKTLIPILFLFSFSSISAQSESEMEALNVYVQFLNESVHGLFTAHALMVISNKEVNRYIDLDSYILNNISNDEVQSNLFDKSDKKNYTTFHTYSPIELSKIAKQKSSNLQVTVANKLNVKVDKIVTILNQINSIRIEIDAFIVKHDLNEKESIYQVFQILEKGVSLFKSYATEHHNLTKDIDALRKSYNTPILDTGTALHNTVQALLLDLRIENDNEISNGLKKLKSLFSEFDQLAVNNTNVNQNTYEHNVKKKISNIIKLLDKYENPDNVPVEYELYGKQYYFHNEIAKRYFNWSGPGYVRYLNALVSETGVPFLKLVEEPVIFKVVYPMKMDEVDELEKEEKQIENKPPTISGRELKFSTPPISINEKAFTLELYDYNMIDHDSISVSFNGIWILENHKLTATPEVLTLELEENKDNVLVFHANNLGIRAPNTVAIAYRYKGRRQRIYLESDLQASETLTIKLENPQ